MGIDPIIGEQPTTRELQLQLVATAVNDKLKETEAELTSLKDAFRLRNDKVARLEAENIRLKMQRTDTELGTMVEALRKEIGKKDRELVDLKRAKEVEFDNGVRTLRRAVDAEQRIVTLQNTVISMQRDRDAANADVKRVREDAAERIEKANQERTEALRKMVDAADKAKKAEIRIAEMEKRMRPKGPSQGLRR